MITPVERVRNLAHKGVLPAAQAEALLEALNPAALPRRSVLTDPLDRVSAERLVLVGLAATVVGLGVERVGVRFDGFLDTHITASGPSFVTSVLDAIAAWPLAATLLWLVARTAGRQGRWIDFLGLVGVARVPIVACAVPSAVRALIQPPPVLEPGQLPTFGFGMLVTVVFAVTGLVWSILILYRGFVTASGLRGGRRIAAAVIALLLAEIAAKTALAIVS
jgi:hypothetical protein